MSMHELEYSLTLSRSRRRSSCGLFHCSGRKSDRRFCDCQAVVEFGGEAHAERPFWREATPAWRVDGACGPGAAQGLSRRFYRPLPYVVRTADMRRLLNFAPYSPELCELAEASAKAATRSSRPSQLPGFSVGLRWCHRADPFCEVMPESLAARLRNRAIARWAQKAWSSRWMGPLSWSWAVLGTIYPNRP